jgi:hypothetical protein
VELFPICVETYLFGRIFATFLAPHFIELEQHVDGFRNHENVQGMRTIVDDTA